MFHKRRAIRTSRRIQLTPKIPPETGMGASVRVSHRVDNPSYKHSGDAGDLIYSLPILVHYGAGPLHLNACQIGVKSDGTKSGLSNDLIDALRPLLESQPYVTEVKLWDGCDVEYDIDIVRLDRNDYRRHNLSHVFLNKFSVPFDQLTPWISVEPNKVAPIVFARSPRYRNHTILWRSFIRDNGSNCIFIGFPDEHAHFQRDCGNITYYPTKDLLEVARVIAGSELFIGNQSAPYAIAEAMKVNTVQEVFTQCPNCKFTRPNATYLESARDRMMFERRYRLKKQEKNAGIINDK